MCFSQILQENRLQKYRDYTWKVYCDALLFTLLFHKYYKRIHLKKYPYYTNHSHVIYCYFQVSPLKHEYTSSVERHMPANWKDWGSILGQGGTFFYSCTNVHVFLHRITRKNTSSKHERYTRKRANRIASLTWVWYTCFRAFELVFCT